MALTEKRISALEAKGFKRWTKGSYDRLYIDATELGLEYTCYKTGNISSAAFCGSKISNSSARQMISSKNYIDVKTGEIHSDNYTLEQAMKAIVEELDELDAQEEQAKQAKQAEQEAASESVAEQSEVFTAESFGADLPENYSCILTVLNNYAETHPDEDPNEIWEKYFAGTLQKYYIDLDDDFFTVRTVEYRDEVYTGRLSAIGIRQDDPEYATKLDSFLEDELHIPADMWEVG